ncbi:phosphoribosylglycinamide formyltransferase [Schaalia sp. JY-X169]|uniref:phosphoribosylglycinamide formyltransferase n=1 Tax=Schaalia sp. JY-X169 TaxID=2758572 RepID=UPI0015F73C2C|nr:phosphoribosylglycinamide formyltransferase [Schaalia sp. JY-X169]
MKARIAVLVSGGGTNLQALLDAQVAGALRSGEVVLVVSDQPGAYALERARSMGVETAVLTEDFEAQLRDLLEARDIDLVVLAGFMRILSAAFTADFDRRIINVHPSLIPAFCGKGFYGLRVHQAALDYGVKVTGATVHFVNEVPDGGEIIAQKAVPVHPDDTPETLQRRVMEEAEWVLLPRACEMISQSLNKGATVECL